MEIPAAQAKAMVEMMMPALENEASITRKVIAAIPEDKASFKLGEKGRTAAQIAWHTVFSEAWFAESIINTNFSMDEEPAPPATIGEIVKWYDEHVPALSAKVKNLSGETLAKSMNFFNLMNMPAVMYLNLWNNHSVHHRGYLAAYLRAMNAKVPSIYGGSADEPFEMPASAGN